MIVGQIIRLAMPKSPYCIVLDKIYQNSTTQYVVEIRSEAKKHSIFDETKYEYKVTIIDPKDIAELIHDGKFVFYK